MMNIRAELERERCAAFADEVALRAAMQAQEQPTGDDEWWKTKQAILQGMRHAAVEIAAKIRSGG